MSQLPATGHHGPHASGHRCYFPSCRFPACLELQADSQKYGFTEAGEVHYPEPVCFPWEGDDAE